MRTLAVAAIAALALSACQDPAGVGLGLIDEEQSDPSVRVVALADLDTLTFDRPAIGLATVAATNSRPQTRVLVGDVLDPVFGDVRALAYVDAGQPAAARSLESDDVREVWLEMPRSYTYGDTTTALPVSLHDIQGDWDASNDYPSDTTFAVGEALVTATLVQADTLVRFNLPASWVSRNAATLVGTTFSDDFEGFALQPEAGFVASPGVVFGLGTLSAQGAALRLATDEDTLSFPLSEVFSSISAQAPAAPPAGILPVRRGTGSEVRFTADLSALGPVPLARGMLRLPLDESFAEVGTFVRPLAQRSVAFGVRGAGSASPTYVPLGVLNVSGGLASLTDTGALTSALQNLLISPETGGFDRYEIRPDLNPDLNPASLDILPVRRPQPGDDSVPRLTLTLVGAPA